MYLVDFYEQVVYKKAKERAVLPSHFGQEICGSWESQAKPNLMFPLKCLKFLFM